MGIIIRENCSLKKYNSFGIEAGAKYLAAFSSMDELEEITRQNKWQEYLVLGGGSNLLFTKNYDGFVLKNEISGINLIKEDEDFVYIKAGAGVNWHRLVMHCVENNWGGIENLALIPGNAGASPIQNIGAYGVEIKDVLAEVEAYHLNEKTIQLFKTADCQFGYRDSVFKTIYKGQFVITSVTYRLRKKPVFNISYGAISQELEKMGIKELSVNAVANAVIQIRRSKLPDPAITGNAGSFFKNPTVPLQIFQSIQQNHPGVVGYPSGAEHIKLAAGWLIEQCGWKGYRKGDAGCHALQALVLVNYGKATGKEIYALSEEILQSVNKKFGVLLEREVNIY